MGDKSINYNYLFLIFGLATSLIASQQLLISSSEAIPGARILSVTADGQYTVFAGTDNGVFREWTAHYSIVSEPFVMDYNVDGDQVVQLFAEANYFIAGLRGRIAQFQLHITAAINTLTFDEDPLNAMVVCNELIFSGHDSGQIKVWNRVDWVSVGVLGNHMGMVIKLEVNKDWLFSAGADGLIMQWQISTLSLNQTFTLNSANYIEIAGTDYPSNDSEYMQGPFSECAERCDFISGCVAYTLESKLSILTGLPQPPLRLQSRMPI
jgi:WD40 repeat protein